MGFWKSLGRVLGAVQPEEEAQCQYSRGSWQCPVIVAPHEGYREGYSVFCSDEHAALDQEESAL
ncbi:hypothetical protein [Rhodococcus gordoniae]|uniref:hypothetical protein n=1 Tax=Rhodococcus gordoniae TaxID=223392 RepID=UPI00352381B4